MDIAEWLRGLGLGQYEAAFRENAIGGAVLVSLTAEDLRDLGIGLIGHRRKLLDAIAILRGDAGTPAVAAETPASSAERRQLTLRSGRLDGISGRGWPTAAMRGRSFRRGSPLSFQGHLDQAIRMRDLSVQEANASASLHSRASCLSLAIGTTCLLRDFEELLPRADAIRALATWPGAWSSAASPTRILATTTANRRRVTDWLCIDKPKPGGACLFAGILHQRPKPTDG
jgi:hypothetical protein